MSPLVQPSLPAPIRITPSRPDCVLPPLPQPVVFGGVPDGDDKVIVTKSGLLELARYVAAERDWIVSASACLAAP